MFLRKYVPAVAAVLALCSLTACNSTSDENVELTQSSAVIKSFSLSADTKVMAKLDTVFFSIDLVKGLIFNADSLPYGSKVTKLVPEITTLEASSVLELKVKRANATDTTYNYLTNSTDSIDFTNPVTIRVVSNDGLTERNYTLRVNVHTVKTDSLRWNQSQRTSLPSLFGYPAAQRTARMGNKMLCLTRSGQQYCMATYTGKLTGISGAMVPASAWTSGYVTFPFTPVVESFAATDDALYILDTAGALWTSADDGANWTATGRTWHHIYGAYGTAILGSKQSGAAWQIDCYPAGDAVALPDGMPVSGTSMPVSYTFPMSANPQMLLVGGVKADGTLTGATWGYDGSTWVKISKRDLPVALADVAVAPYATMTGGGYIPYAIRPTLITFGGRDSGGQVTNTVYISADYGFNWSKAGELMQLPEYLGKFAAAQAFVQDATMHADVTPRITTPLEQWECPYIFLFGGITDQGALRNTIWPGVINRFTFKPVE